LVGGAVTAAAGGALAEGTGVLAAAGRGIQAAEVLDDAANVVQGTGRALNGDPGGALQAGLGAVGLRSGTKAAAQAAEETAGVVSRVEARSANALSTGANTADDAGSALSGVSKIKSAAGEIEDSVDYSPFSGVPYATAASGKNFIKLEHVEGAAGETALLTRIEGSTDEIVIKSGGPVTQNGPDIVTFNREAGQVTLWDNKNRRNPATITASKTFTKQDPLDNSLEIAEKAIENSSLSAADKMAAFQAIEQGNVRLITAGSGNAKNSVVLQMGD
jgi:hypothetical protein